jgi:hypothetical protein
MDTEGVQRTRDTDSSQAGEETEGVEGKGGQDLRLGISDCGVQSETGFSRLPQGMCGTREAQ